MWYFLLTAALIALDQGVKWRTVAHLAVGESAPLLPPLLEWLYVQNTGAAWNALAGHRFVLIVLSVLLMAAVLLLVYRYQVRHAVGRLAAALILAGGIGNLIDRVRQGFVVDMFHFLFWKSYPVFNVADICAVCGAVLAAVYYLFIYGKTDAV